MRMTTVKTGACAALLLAASAGLSFAQTTTGGTGSTGNDSNNPAVIQNDSTGAVQGGAASGTMGTMDNSGAVAKPGKACGQRGENQGTSQPDGQVACE
jgi:hypothetical protein